MTYTDILKNKQKATSSTTANNFQNMLNKLQGVNTDNLGNNTSNPNNPDPQFSEALLNAGVSSGSNVPSTTPEPSTPITSQTTTPTLSEALEFSQSTISQPTPNVVTPPVQETPKVNADSINTGGIASEVKGNEITTGEGYDEVKYSDILDNATNNGINNAGAERVNADNGTVPKVEPKTEETGTVAGTVPGTTTLPMTFEEYILSQKSKADDAYKRAVADAEIERKRATVEAQNAYDHSKSTYGSQAAALSSMGLTGSGYSDYLDSEAYAQMRGDMNAANRTKQQAIIAAESAKSNADSNYDAMYVDYLNQRETNNINTFNNMYSNLGGYTGADIDTIGKANGLSDDQISQLKTARLDLVKKTLNSAESYSKADLDYLFDVSIPEEKALYDQYYGKIRDEAQRYVNSMTVDTFEDMSESTAKSTLAQFKADGIDTTAAENAYNAAYNLVTNDNVKLSKETLSDNVKIELDGEQYTLKYDSDIGSSLKKEILSAIKLMNLPNNSVFVYKGDLYVKTGADSVKKLTAAWSKTDSYNTVVKAFSKKKITKE